MICCAPGCSHKSGIGCHFYNFPSPNDGPDWEKWYNIWVLRINRVNKNGELWRPETLNTKLCSCHFRPEDQWDPKSRKGGLKCKEPVFFDYNRDMSSSPSPSENQQLQHLEMPCITGNEGSEKGLHHYVANPSSAAVENSEEPVTKKRHVQSPQGTAQRSKAVLRSCSTVPKLKIREYLQKQDGTTLQSTDSDVNIWSSSSQGVEKQYLIPTIKMPGTHTSHLDLQNRQGSVSLLADSRVDAANLQVMNPEISHIEFIEVVGSEDNSEANDDIDSTIMQQMCIKHEWVDTSHEVMHVRAALPEQHATPPLSVKREADCSLLPNDNTVVNTDSVVLPRIVSSHSLESNIIDIDGHVDRPVTDFQQFVNIEHPQENPQENLEVVPQKSQVNKARISNVKPIRIFTSKSINPALKVQQESISVGPIDREEAGGNTNHTDAENVYDQIFNHLVAPMSQSHQDSMQSTVSHESTVTIADMLSDHLTSSDLSNHLNLTQALERVKELEKALNVERFGLQRYMGSDEKIKFYTGFRSVDTLMRFFWRIEPDALTTERSSKWRDAVNFAKETLHECQDLTEKVIPYMDELFLFLCHVWLGLQPEDLADRFALPSPKDAQFIILRWVHYLHITLPSPTVSTKSTTTKSIRLQGKYCNTRVLLHPVKIRAQQKSILNHLSSTNLTSLIGFSPSGELVFTSDPMLEVASNRELVQNSGILSFLQRGEGVILEDEFVKDDVFLQWV